jgi:hypothetical protein
MKVQTPELQLMHPLKSPKTSVCCVSEKIQLRLNAHMLMWQLLTETEAQANSS